MMILRSLFCPLAVAAGLLFPLSTLAQTPAAPPAPAPGKAALVQEGCLGCHGGPAANGAVAIPGLAGRDAQELRSIMTAFRAGERPGTIMNRIVRGYSEDELAAAADYFSKLKP
jgi:sulfide dehydrogenase cytochrome subunit